MFAFIGSAKIITSDSIPASLVIGDIYWIIQLNNVSYNQEFQLILIAYRIIDYGGHVQDATIAFI